MSADSFGRQFDGEPVAAKSFAKADSANLFWNRKGSALLIQTIVDVDQSGRSYYGENNLFFISLEDKELSCNVPLAKEGPIYDVDWSLNSKEFIVVYGFMPAKATLFDRKCNPIFDFGTGPRNLVRFSPHGSIIALAGFGTLRGEIEMWDRTSLSVIARPFCPDSTVFEWCPNGRHFMTATTSPRLRVGNGVKVWDITGALLYAQDYAQLWDATWRLEAS